MLVVKGEHFAGCQQDLAVSVTALVPALADLDIPVSCLERGRHQGFEARPGFRGSSRSLRETVAVAESSAGALPVTAIRQRCGVPSMTC